VNFEDNVDFSQFGKSFQENMCQLILQDRAFADQMQEVLNINFLELKYLQVFVKKVFDYKDEYGIHPSVSIITTILRADLENENELIKKQVRDFYVRMLKTEVQDTDYIKTTALDFCKKQVLKEAIIKSVPLLQKSSFEEVQKLINDAMKLGVNNDFGHLYIEDFEKRFELRFRNPISTGWKLIDNLIQGGLGQGELGLVLAATGTGKSMILTHLGSRALKAGKTVIHYTLEMLDTAVGQRYDSCITGIPINDLPYHKEEVFNEIKDIEGQLIIKEYPTKSASTSTIEAHLEKIRQKGISIDMIIVDYADLLRTSGKALNEKRHELESIYENLRGVAQKYKCPLWTASQTNRDGSKEKVVTMNNVSEAYNKCFVADFIISLSRQQGDKDTNGGNVHVAKNRNGPDGHVFPIFMDPSNVSIKVLPQQETMEDIRTKSVRDIYLNMKKEKDIV